MPGLELVESNVQIEEDGTWVEHPLGYRFLIASMESPRFRKCLRGLLRKERRRHRSREVPLEIIEQHTRTAMAKHVLLDWADITYQDAPLPYSEEFALRILTEDQFHKLRDFITEVAMDEEEFACETLEEERKNSPKT